MERMPWLTPIHSSSSIRIVAISLMVIEREIPILTGESSLGNLGLDVGSEDRASSLDSS